MILSVIGGGNMARALIGGLIDTGWPAEHILVTTRSPESRAKLLRDLGIRELSSLSEIHRSDLILLAVKPQQLFDVAKEIQPYLSGQLILSVAAGISTSLLRKWLNGYSRIIRAMPNTPARIHAGMSGLFATPETSESDRILAQNIFTAIGRIVWLEKEDDMNALTALSGSGPAYVFYMMEALIEAGIAEGLTTEISTALTLATFDGASRLAMASQEEVNELRTKVTSKGGTTEKALEIMIRANIKHILHQAVSAAAHRSREIGNELALMQKNN
ncbi:MAG: pyrroline-5-carboxylate reductase [Proteobacteria bacterium]|nr:pyrroline-5-carboxylate reductase [Pseudomonadota bacterium]